MATINGPQRSTSTTLTCVILFALLGGSYYLALYDLRWLVGSVLIQVLVLIALTKSGIASEGAEASWTRPGIGLLLSALVVGGLLFYRDRVIGSYSLASILLPTWLFLLGATVGVWISHPGRSMPSKAYIASLYIITGLALVTLSYWISYYLAPPVFE